LARPSIDVQLPGMVYTSTVHAPMQMAAPISWNDAQVRAVPGVVDIVQLTRGVAVVAERFEQEMAARHALKVVWDKSTPTGGFNSDDTLQTDYVAIANADKAQVKTVKQSGDDDAAFGAASTIYKAEYRSDYGYHAQM
jgi:isoquinoline 1-oxidoreductase beta subunit